MTLLSAREDVLLRTLAAVSGIPRKLAYVAGLRNADMRYEHAGLSRAHGEVAVQRTVHQIHTELFQECLRTRLRELVAQVAAPEDEPEGADPLTVAAAQLTQAHPAGCTAAEARHFNSTVVALRELGAAQAAANRQAA